MSKHVITFHYSLTNEEGKLLDSSLEAEPLSFLEGAGQIIPGLESVLLTMNLNAQQTIKVHYNDAYGAYDQKLVFRIPKSQFPQQTIKPGDMFEIGQGQHQQIVMVIEVKDQEIVVDGNHPLAGKNLVFDVKIVEKRPATHEELAHGHVHGLGGAHH